MCLQESQSPESGGKGSNTSCLGLTTSGLFPVFSALAQAELERLARTSADIQLRPGEFAVHLPDDRKRFEIIVARDVGFGL
jgi:hypothetical protein